MKRMLVWMLLLLITLPHSAWGYSYGDPNKEDIAEALIIISGKLNGSPADWEGAFQQYLVHKKVLELEFGTKLTGTLEANFASKDKELLIANYRGMLALNIERRFNYVEKELADYSKTKLLLAKSKGTFDVLKPSVKDAATITAVEASFNKALEALGNPGLFGVGKVEPNLEQFKTESSFILSKVKPLFTIKYAQAPAQASASQTETKPAQTTQETAPKAAQTQTSAQAETGAKTNAAAGAVASDAAKSTASQPSSESQSQISQSEASNEAAVKASAEGDKPAAEASGVTGQAEQAASADAKTDGTVKTEASAITSVSGGEAGGAKQETAAAAPLDVTVQAESKVNPVVTIMVIGLVLLVGGAAVWFGLKKGLFKF
ncbi:hypothetical protein [Paenibacillus sp. YYML68]|uniref:hypothetical protein n=1 Tax=Paenibacillus sp. YYML68 TaxID=2909250 RepID=UPI00248FF7A1|nr:hypothetical protein [Paenibacillus sp. YYML68]